MCVKWCTICLEGAFTCTAHDVIQTEPGIGGALLFPCLKRRRDDSLCAKGANILFALTLGPTPFANVLYVEEDLF